MSETDRPEEQPAPESHPEPERAEMSAFLPNRASRLRFESFAVRVIATAGIVGIGTALAAILGTQDVRGWIIGLVVSGLSVLLAAVLWSSRTL
jgi:hypothetical protein